MISFVVPFRSKASSNNWPYHSSLLLRTLHSIINQVDKNFKVIVIYTDYPENKIEHPNLIWLKYPFSFLTTNDITDYESYAKQYFTQPKFAEFAMDQARRSIYGSKLALELGSSHVMSVDADDLVSNKIAWFVNQQENKVKPGWFVNKGYVYLDGKNYIYRYPKNMNHFCGSTHIVRADIISIPNFESRNLLEYNFFSSHAWLLTRLAQYQNIKLEPLSFSAIIYILNNVSWMGYGKSFEGGPVKKLAKLLLYGQLLGNNLKNEFGLENNLASN